MSVQHTEQERPRFIELGAEEGGGFGERLSIASPQRISSPASRSKVVHSRYRPQTEARRARISDSIWSRVKRCSKRCAAVARAMAVRSASCPEAPPRDLSCWSGRPVTVLEVGRDSEQQQAGVVAHLFGRQVLRGWMARFSQMLPSDEVVNGSLYQ